MRKRLAICLLLGMLCINSSIVNASSLVWTQPWAGYSKFAASSSFGNWEADDFMLGSTSNLTSLAFWGGRRDTVPVVDSFRIRIFESFFDSSLGYERPADSPLYDDTVLGNGGQTLVIGESEVYYYMVNLPQNRLVNANSHYWISILANSANDPNDKWWGWNLSGTYNLDVAQVNGTGFSYYPIDQSPFSSTNYDFAFELFAEPVPEPISLLALTAGLLALARRKRRS